MSDTDVKVFNIHTGQFEAPDKNDPGAKFAVAMHEAIRDEKPLPSDRTAEALRQAEPGRAGVPEPVITTETQTGLGAPAETPTTAVPETPTTATTEKRK